SDASEPLRFNASYVSGPYVAPVGTVVDDDGAPVGGQRPVVFTAAPVEAAEPEEVAAEPDPVLRGRPELPPPPPSGPVAEEGIPDSLLDVVVKRLTGHGRPAHEV